MKLSFAYRLKKKDLVSVAAMAAVVALIMGIRGIDHHPGVIESCPGCIEDIGTLEREGHYEEMLWSGVRHVHESFNESLAQFTRSNGFLSGTTGTTKNCIDCHNESPQSEAPSLGELWVRFPRLDKETGRIIDFEKAVQHEFVRRYGGTKPFYNDVRITEIMVYAYEKARRKKLVFDVEPDDGVPLSDADLDRLNASSHCRDVFARLGRPKGDIAPYVVKGCNIFTRTTENRPAGYRLFWKTRMNCTSCHLQGGTKEYAAHLGDAAVSYPGVYSSNNLIYTNRMRIARCYAHSINELLYGANSEVYKLITLYMTWIAERSGIPIGAPRDSRGIHNVRGTAARHASIIAGQKSYQKLCQRCHGPAGYGTNKYDFDPDFSPPPITGSEAFVQTATLSYPDRLASFILNNMPPGATHEYPLVTPQQALDIAEFIRVQTRPSAPNTNNLTVFYNYVSNNIMEWWFAEKVPQQNL